MVDATSQNLLADDEAQPITQEGGCGGHCTCGAQDDTAPELDVRQIPPAIRHASIFGALGAIRAGESIVLIAPHAPVPLLEQLEASQPGEWTSTIAQSGPEEWRTRLTRAL
ncbi:DUF2249 domain-containing protein [Demequina lutea]|uniref:Uncharacterized protein (DUF2249 family) n=1 Tax=Demequina lutea TaxID=431489 RepID=A0A7Y9ZA54_9MICO|nr:DUF2249 domain-containing protein [Demequina lutea]NYI41030.1 uncharacterized protein (DUF2249 family) [Demequina lutea]